MQKATILLVAVSGVVGLGIILSFYGNQVLFEDLARAEADVSAGQELRVRAELEASDMQKGIYAIQIVEYRGGISMEVFDPQGFEIASHAPDKELTEGSFDVGMDGTYEMIIRNDGSEQVRIFAVMGPEPDAGAKSLGFVSLYILVIGLMGMAGIGILVVRNRRRS